MVSVDMKICFSLLPALMGLGWFLWFLWEKPAKTKLGS